MSRAVQAAARPTCGHTTTTLSGGSCSGACGKLGGTQERTWRYLETAGSLLTWQRHWASRLTTDALVISSVTGAKAQGKGQAGPELTKLTKGRELAWLQDSRRAGMRPLLGLLMAKRCPTFSIAKGSKWTQANF